MIKITIRDGEDFIKLGQAMKKAGIVSSGVEAKIYINNGEVRVNGEIETRRGRKLRKGDQIDFQDETVVIEQ